MEKTCYEALEIEVVTFVTRDVITTSDYDEGDM